MTNRPAARPWRALSVCLALALAAAPARAAEDASAVPARERLERASKLVEQGLAALREGRTDAAVEILEAARSAAPDRAVTAYDLALALAAAGKLDQAREAYVNAVRSAGADDAAGPAARHNLAALHLDQARTAAAALADPDALADKIREQPGPGGEPLTPETVAMLAQQMRGKLVEDGLSAAKEAVGLLRETVRADPAAADAVRNLVLAQRARRVLLAEQERQKDEQENGGDDGDENAPPEGQEGSEGGDAGQQNDGDQSDPPSAGEDPEPPDAQPETGQEGESTDPSGDEAPETSAEPRDLDREAAERALERLLEAAARKARQVERMRAERVRRGGVERDW